MRLVGFREARATYVGVIVGANVAKVAEVDEFYADLSTSLQSARRMTIGELSLSAIEQVPAVPRSARVLCVGLNYRAHAAEGGFAPPEYPTIFGRWTASLVSNGVPVPAIDERLDWEGELAAIVGTQLTNATEATALAGVMGYAAFNDISARTYQRHSMQWTMGKNADRSGPMSTIVTADEVGDPARGLRLRTRVNDEVVQDASTADMIFSVGRILSYMSEVTTLNPGDVIVTGTPEGVGFARKPPRFMKPGDVVEVEIERVGTVRNPIVDRSMRP